MVICMRKWLWWECASRYTNNLQLNGHEGKCLLRYVHSNSIYLWLYIPMYIHMARKKSRQYHHQLAYIMYLYVTFPNDSQRIARVEVVIMGYASESTCTLFIFCIDISMRRDVTFLKATNNVQNMRVLSESPSDRMYIIANCSINWQRFANY